MKLSFELFPLIHVKETNSTNSYLQTLSSQQEIEEFTTVVTDFQISGRGQRGNSWESEPNKNLLFSFILFPDFLEVRRQFFISQIVSLSIKEELETYTTDISIKWPNDIYWKEKKICGMLIENDVIGKNISRSVIGIGININQKEFYGQAPNPVSLRQITGEQYEILGILKNIMSRIQYFYQLLRKGDMISIVEQYENSLFRKDGIHWYKDINGKFLARIIAVEPEGKLILEDEMQIKREYLFKEVEYLLNPINEIEES